MADIYRELGLVLSNVANVMLDYDSVFGEEATTGRIVSAINEVEGAIESLETVRYDMRRAFEAVKKAGEEARNDED